MIFEYRISASFREIFDLPIIKWNLLFLTLLKEIWPTADWETLILMSLPEGLETMSPESEISGLKKQIFEQNFNLAYSRPSSILVLN